MADSVVEQICRYYRQTGFDRLESCHNITVSILLSNLWKVIKTSMLNLKLYDNVILKDGRRASIVEIFPDSYIADIEIGDGDYETQFIYLEQIDKVL